MKPLDPSDLPTPPEGWAWEPWGFSGFASSPGPGRGRVGVDRVQAGHIVTVSGARGFLSFHPIDDLADVAAAISDGAAFLGGDLAAWVRP